MAESIGVAIVKSRLDYANPLLFGTTCVGISKFQHIQKTLAHIVVSRPFAASVSGPFYNLHWLPVNLYINLKITRSTSILTPNQSSCLFSFVRFKVVSWSVCSSG